MTSQIKNITILAKQTRREEAKALLDRIAATVLPAMKRHKWEVKTLSEFYPENDSLHGLNINRGQCIRVRLRDGKNASVFLPFEHCLGTMIHELVHMEIGPHSAEFYKAMDALWDEVEKDMTGNLTNAAVYAGRGVTLGGASSSSVRDARLAHLDKTQRLSDLAAGSGCKLGGRQDWKNLSRRELALAAAERRLQDSRQCGADMLAEEESSQHAASQWLCCVCTAHNADTLKKCHFCGEARDASPTSSTTVARMPLITSSSDWYCPSCSTSNSSAAATCDVCHTTKASDGWSCASCTYFNASISLICVCCGTRRNASLSPQARTDIWSCIACTYTNSTPSITCELCGTLRTSDVAPSLATSETTDAIWACAACTYANAGSATRCSMCDSTPRRKRWVCSNCSTINDTGDILCVTCSQER